MNAADFIASGCATFVRVSTELKGGFTGAMRIAHLADAFRLRAEPHGPTIYARHLCMAISNCTYYESLVTTSPAKREAGISATGMVAAPPGPGVGLQPGFEYPAELEQYVVDLDEAALLHREAGAS
jgi:L-alanine-DL-glutamate epimerase-like enolase superfamily enzyme